MSVRQMMELAIAPTEQRASAPMNHLHAAAQMAGRANFATRVRYLHYLKHAFDFT